MTSQSAALRMLPSVDSPEIAAARRHELEIPRDVAAELGRSAVEASVSGIYFNRAGAKVDGRDLVHAACAWELVFSLKRPAILDGRSWSSFNRSSFSRFENSRNVEASRRRVSPGWDAEHLKTRTAAAPGGRDARDPAGERSPARRVMKRAYGIPKEDGHRDRVALLQQTARRGPPKTIRRRRRCRRAACCAESAGPRPSSASVEKRRHSPRSNNIPPRRRRFR